MDDTCKTEAWTTKDNMSKDCNGGATIYEALVVRGSGEDQAAANDRVLGRNVAVVALCYAGGKEDKKVVFKRQYQLLDNLPRNV